MRNLLLLILISCSTMTEGVYKKRYHLEDHHNKDVPKLVYEMLLEKMTKCYPQSEYPKYEKTVGNYDESTQLGTVFFEIDNQSLGPRPLVIVDIMKDPNGLGSIVKVYSKGDIFRSPRVYKHQIQKWLNGKKVDCHGHGQI